MLEDLEKSKPLIDLEETLRFCPVCGHVLKSREKTCPVCGASNAADLYPDVDERGRKGKWREDTAHCPQCHKPYREADDRYCRFCGTKRSGEAARYFEVSPDYMECIYGPAPVTLHYRCKRCRAAWTGSNWSEESYCPRCGTRVTGREEGKDPSQNPSGLRNRLKCIFSDDR